MRIWKKSGLGSKINFKKRKKKKKEKKKEKKNFGKTILLAVRRQSVKNISLISVSGDSSKGTVIN